MSTTIPQRELRNQNKAILDRVAAGESFTVTRDGVPLADLIPHLTTAAPPRFRAANDVAATHAMTREQAEAWLADIRAARDDLDTAPVDPWERARAHG
ncbi:MAG: type II toxin-antitoxin system prevent-host-death family antitoxin [Microbacterium sp.]|uniref:type II toxin-antitoxin system Phd/YefM family antitoxin n=1 Tax=Microbacterium sp. TaxID=51671 RepID=UPI0039E3EDE5